MKKKNLIILFITCLLSLFALTGLLVYAFNLQARKDMQNNKDGQNTNTITEAPDQEDDSNDITPTGTADDIDGQNPTPTVSPSVSPTPAVEAPELTDQDNSEPIILAFAGDVNFDEDSYPVAKYDSENKGILGCLSADLVEEMNSADIMMLNNEFAYSTRGTEAPDKQYTFRANPERVGILGEMGVDIVSLANNHSLDFGPEALEDTFDTLDNADIDYVGAGENLDRAKAPVYYTIGSKKIAFVAASRVVPVMEWYATDSKLGVIGTYDPTLILGSIEEAKANSDFVVIFVHWGEERNNYPVAYQRTMAKQYIDAGADAVVGCHPHVLQGFEFYNGKPIAYSLGNFWFNRTKRETGLLKLYIDPDGAIRTQLLPAMGENTFTSIITKEEDRNKYFDFMREISYNVSIDENGFITEAQ